MTIEIKSRFAERVLYSSEKETIKEALEEAVAAGVDLYGASLDGASLDGASLDGASLDGASLVRARLDGASLDGASLVRARLDGASLDGASLVRASLDGASLDGASLDGASLDGASLDPIKNDMFIVLMHAPDEVAGLREKLVAGQVDGSVYEGACACLLGTIASIRNCNYMLLDGITPNSNRPIERFFMAIRPGQNPENCQFAKLAVEWIDEFTKLSSKFVKAGA